MRYITEQEVIAINLLVIERYSPKEQKGVKLPELLNSAINRPKQSAFGEEAYPTIFGKGGALFESLAKNHPFHNANKRTAFLALIQFLAYNGFQFTMSQKQAEDFVVDVVNQKYEFDEMVAIIKEYSVKR
ncbi:type II toxin-antitoxin system death-on-curing family toxin [Thalassobacillus sp. C254]|uniref:type II toxin-antitoxin system death-on-curing family toxin n=1 Tax=Thalassobacillus sp. C254 TaxID=1225341 RepID=UPI0006D25028|nr:type II toxin-antitoxin system death-on-curing family toxin [Thalassobacillus sp. C254]